MDKVNTKQKKKKSEMEISKVDTSALDEPQSILEKKKQLQKSAKSKMVSFAEAENSVEVKKKGKKSKEPVSAQSDVGDG